MYSFIPQTLIKTGTNYGFHTITTLDDNKQFKEAVNQQCQAMLKLVEVETLNAHTRPCLPGNIHQH